MTAQNLPGDRETGVSATLARWRGSAIRSVSYVLDLSIPEHADAPVLGEVRVTFTLERPGTVMLDVAEPACHVDRLEVDGVAEPPAVRGEHLCLSERASTPGVHSVRVWFTGHGAGLHRRETFVYSLLVPDRARTVFPCFDQPDLKASLSLTLDVPEAWTAVSNTTATTDVPDGGRRRIAFAPTRPLPTYLFAFVAGRLVCTAGAGRVRRLVHVVSDAGAVAREAAELCRLHDQALAWMERYTGVPHPFDALDVVLLPDFPFSGMEHPGALAYNAGSQLLETTATVERRLARARTIAHEVAHLWFGDLVTMTWFDDVWLKEVFAELLAARIVEPSADDDDQLRFLLQHHPDAYAVDRTAGANPIRQPLENLDEASQLYGPIIYMKAPVAFRQLEAACGAEVFRGAARTYLQTHAFGSADWDDLKGVLETGAPIALADWSRDWIESPGRPTCEVVMQGGTDGIADAALVVTDPAGRGRTWPQRLHVTLGWPDATRVVEVDVRGARTPIPGVAGMPMPSFVLPDGRGLGYGLFLLDPASAAWLLAKVETIQPAVTRGVVWLTLWDNMLEDRMPPSALLEALLRSMRSETHEHLAERLRGWVTRIVWRFLSTDERTRVSPRLEALLRDGMARARFPRERAGWLAAFRDSCGTADAASWLAQLSMETLVVPGLPLSEDDLANLALHAALRDPANADAILAERHARTADPDTRTRLEFLTPAVSPDLAVREGAFRRLLDVSHRGREPWVLDALSFLNHPLRQDDARRFIAPALACLPEIQRTGGIFLPRRWTEALLGGHNTAAALTIVDAELAHHADWPERLRWIVLAAADELRRAVR